MGFPAAPAKVATCKVTRALGWPKPLNVSEVNAAGVVVYEIPSLAVMQAVEPRPDTVQLWFGLTKAVSHAPDVAEAIDKVAEAGAAAETVTQTVRLCAMAVF